MTVTIHDELIQGSEEWHAARCGLLTASEVCLIMTPTLKVAANEKARMHAYELAAQRISKYVEPSYVGDNMLRGWEDEVKARELYAEHIAPVTECGFITNDKWGFTLGYSPDGLVGADGLLEAKSRIQKHQVKTIVEHVATGGLTIPDEYLLQCQTGLMVSERDWLDFLSFSGGLPMPIIRVWPDDEVQIAIWEAAQQFDDTVRAIIEKFGAAVNSGHRLIPTERTVYEEIIT